MTKAKTFATIRIEAVLSLTESAAHEFAFHAMEQYAPSTHVRAVHGTKATKADVTMYETAVEEGLMPGDYLSEPQLKELVACMECVDSKGTLITTAEDLHDLHYTFEQDGSSLNIETDNVVEANGVLLYKFWMQPDVLATMHEAVKTHKANIEANSAQEAARTEQKELDAAVMLLQRRGFKVERPQIAPIETIKKARKNK